MSTPQVINEVATAINEVISVIAGSVLKVLPVFVLMLMGLAVLDVFLGGLFEDDAKNQTPFLSDHSESEIQHSEIPLGSNVFDSNPKVYKGLPHA